MKRKFSLMWSTGNEEPYHTTDVGYRIHKAVASYIRKLDNTRLITAAEDKSPEKSTIYDECDIVGINYNLNIYDTVHKLSPDKVLFTCECVDANGNMVPDALEFVRFSVNSPAVIVGTGSDNCDHKNVANSERKMYMGKIRIAVKPEKGQKRLKLLAVSDNCKSDIIEIDL